MAGEMSVITQSVVTVTISSSLNSFGSERRFQKDLTIAGLKDKLVLLTGASVGSMKLEVYNTDNKLICLLDNDTALLGSYPVDDGMRIHVVDPNAKIGEFEDVSKVEKFEISADEYAKRADSVRAFKEKMKLGRFKEVTPEEQQRLDEEKKLKEQQEKEKAESIKVGDRCEVRVPGQPARRGCVQYVGTTDFKPGYWIGVQYDEPLGKHNGSVKGRQYFQCPDKYGGFVKPENIEVGDFPEEGMDFEDDEM
ncbi:hypothetical protein ACF0H5_002625 [Mactra antiquata]